MSSISRIGIVIAALTAISVLSSFNRHKKVKGTGGDGEITIQVSDNKKQLVRLGIDAERLWHWHSNIKDKLAALAAGELKAEFARVAITPSYELQKGAKDEAAYDQILEVMNALRKANPHIHFFASPRPVHESYSREDKISIWGHKDNVPFSPFPVWIQQWERKGTKKLKDGSIVPRWDKGAFDVQAWAQYYADYLNFMHLKGFDIEYMDVTNEQTIVQPAHTKYLADNLPSKLNKGVKMPKLIAPSSWSTLGATQWLQSIDRSKGEQNGFSIAACHNTGKPGVFADFARDAQLLGKEVWNTELHAWTGIQLHDEIMNSSVFWEHMRAGFTGIDTWLFFGPLKGRDHTMVHSDGGVVKTSGKYEIFKQVVNNANGGNYVEISQPIPELETAAFIKDNILSVWVLNKSDKPFDVVSFNLPESVDVKSKVDLVQWHKALPVDGKRTGLLLTRSNQFQYKIAGQSLFFFRIKLLNK